MAGLGGGVHAVVPVGRERGARLVEARGDDFGPRTVGGNRGGLNDAFCGSISWGAIDPLLCSCLCSSKTSRRTASDSFFTLSETVSVTPVVYLGTRLILFKGSQDPDWSHG